MALTEITLRANNRDTNNSRGPRQTTLFDSLGAAQRRHKRQRKAAGQENASIENSRADATEKAVKRARTEVPECTAAVRPQKLCEARSVLAVRRFGMTSAHTAQRYRQRQSLTMDSVFATSRLASLVSPATGVFQLYADTEPQRGVLPLACKYSANGEQLALVDESGFVSVFGTRTVDAQSDVSLEPILRWKAHDNSAFDVEWRADCAQMVTASADETLRVWDVEHQQCMGSFVGHAQTVRSVSWRSASMHCFSSASRDGSIMIWDSRCNKERVDGEYVYRPVNVIGHAHNLGSSKKPMRGKKGMLGGSVTAICHLQHNTDLLASVGSTSEIVKFWDVRMKAHVRPFALPTPAMSTLLSTSSAGRSRGTASLSLDPDGTRLYSACNDNSVYVHNALMPGQPIARLTAPEFECQSFNVGTSMSTCGRHLAAGSSSGNVVVWELDRMGTNSSGRRAVLQAHTKEAGCVAWYPGKDKTQLATCGDDGVLRLWEENAKLAESAKTDPTKQCSWGVSQSQKTESLRLLSQLVQASQNVLEWQERHARVSEELARLKAGESKDTWPAQQQRYPFGGQFGFQYPGFRSNAYAGPMMFAAPNGQPMGTEAEASSASLLTALNAGSQPF
ncbi:hypothetical protein IW145_001784 [Coemansia sp. RSA 521]|nr:hypothetical protein IW145_001784 [Coemansia sp. RSA 521]KAJ2272078.1 hypothetical protein J3F81_003202 [Coemansia sp. RSA 371]